MFSAFFMASDIILRKVSGYFFCAGFLYRKQTKPCVLDCHAKMMLSGCCGSETSDMSVTVEQADVEPCSENITWP